MEISLSGRAIEILKSGGLLNFISKKVIKWKKQ
jgi:tRNA(Met) C34 N-acetyltransferase TmcA